MKSKKLVTNKKMMKKGNVVLAIPDIHFPAQHPDLFPFLKAVKAKFKPDAVVCLGDEIDAAALSQWEANPDMPSAGDELTQAIELLHVLYKIFPKVYVCESNHTARIYRKALSGGLPKRLLKSYNEILEAPDTWVWQHSWEIDGVKYEHGEGFSGQMGALKAATANMQPTVIGHLHSYAGIQYYANSKYLIWGFNVGCLIDVHHPAFNYAKNVKAKPIIGVGIIDNGVPRFLPMSLNAKGRWTGKL